MRRPTFMHVIAVLATLWTLAFASLSGAADRLVVVSLDTLPDGSFLSRPRPVVASVDGLYVYAARWDPTDPEIGIYAVDPSTGFLTPTVGMAIPEAASALALSADDLYLYMGSMDEIAVYSRDLVTGTLTFIESQDSGSIPELDSMQRIRLSPDGSQLYAVAEGSNALLVFSRDPGDGTLTFEEVHEEGVGGVSGLESVAGLALSPDGKHVYARGHDAIAIFSRDGVSGLLTYLSTVAFPGDGGLVVSTDGMNVYSGPVRFSRNDVTGDLTYVEGTVLGVEAIAISPDGTHLNWIERDLLPGATLWEASLDVATGAFIDAEGIRFDDYAPVFLPGVGLLQSLSLSPDGDRVYVTHQYDHLSSWRRSSLRCPEEPRTDCAPSLAGGSKVTVKSRSGTAKLKFVWRAGATVPLGDFGDPVTNLVDQTLCVFDGPGHNLTTDLLVTGGIGCGKGMGHDPTKCWAAAGTSGFKYRNKSGHPSGVSVVKVKAGDPGKARVVLKTVETVDVQEPPWTLPVTVQLQSDAGTCQTATFSETKQAKQNQLRLFRARSD